MAIGRLFEHSGMPVTVAACYCTREICPLLYTPIKRLKLCGNCSFLLIRHLNASGVCIFLFISRAVATSLKGSSEAKLRL
jgi:hypothetical protein